MNLAESMIYSYSKFEPIIIDYTKDGLVRSFTHSLTSFYKLRTLQLRSFVGISTHKYFTQPHLGKKK